MAYDRVITACDRATSAATQQPEGWRQGFHDEMVRAQAILVELMSVLQVKHQDPAVAELSSQLASLYDFAIDGLVRANLEKRVDVLAGVRSVIEGLREAWVTGVLDR